jgi:hypothetical protein
MEFGGGGDDDDDDDDDDNKNKILSLWQAVQAHNFVRCRGPHIF